MQELNRLLNKGSVHPPRYPDYDGKGRVYGNYRITLKKSVAIRIFSYGS